MPEIKWRLTSTFPKSLDTLYGATDLFAKAVAEATEIGTSLPFGLNSRQQTSWLQVGGGAELFNDFLRSYNLIAFAAGNTGCQMGGWDLAHEALRSDVQFGHQSE